MRLNNQFIAVKIVKRFDIPNIFSSFYSCASSNAYTEKAVFVAIDHYSFLHKRNEMFL